MRCQYLVYVVVKFVLSNEKAVCSHLMLKLNFFLFKIVLLDGVMFADNSVYETNIDHKILGNFEVICRSKYHTFVFL